MVELNPAGEDFSQQQHRKIPPTLILKPTDDMAVMQEEIFGPLLPVKAYDRIEDAIDYVTAPWRSTGSEPTRTSASGCWPPRPAAGPPSTT